MSHSTNQPIAGTLTGDMGQTGTRDSHGVHHSGAGMTAHKPQTGTSATQDAQSFGSAGVPPTAVNPTTQQSSYGHGLLSGLETAGGAMGVSSAAQTHHTGAVGTGIAAPGAHSTSHGTSHQHGATAVTTQDGLAPPLDDTYGSQARLITPEHTSHTTSTHNSHAPHSSHTHAAPVAAAAAAPVAASAAAVDHSSHSHAQDGYANQPHKLNVFPHPQETVRGGAFGDQAVGGPVHHDAAVGASGAHDRPHGSEPIPGQSTGTHKPTIGDKLSGSIDKMVGGITKNHEKVLVGEAKLAGENYPGVAAGVAGEGEIMAGRSGSSGTHHAKGTVPHHDKGL